MAGRGYGASVRVALLATVLVFGLAQAALAADSGGKAPSGDTSTIRAKVDRILGERVTQEQRQAAADRMELLRSIQRSTSDSLLLKLPPPEDGVRSLVLRDAVDAAVIPAPGPGGVPDYFGSTPNWAYSPLLRKFVDGLPGLGASKANNLGQYLSVAKPDTISYPGCDYYEIELREYTEQLHSDLPPTKLRGYVQVNNGTDPSGRNTLVPDPIHYLGPTIFATKDRPVRVKFTNKLPVGAGGDLFIPVDTTVMGAGEGPTGAMYTQNRATLHLHGGITPWISDGTPHQWITPAGEDTPYPKGVSVKNVPDMPDPGDGSMTFFYSNAQSARMLWIHDHSYGITRLNVYAGEASAYMLTDDTEKKLIADGTIPSEQIPLIIQDKTFVDAATIGITDPTWDWGTTAPVPHTGDLWVPHVYVPAQNPADPGGINATGRWHYGPWFWPPVKNIEFPPIANPYYDPINAPWEPGLMPATPNPSMGMENYNDTPMVNGTAYPTVTVKPKSYRFRILNAANDRFFNLQLYVADGTTVSSDGRRNTEVKMIPASLTPGAPDLWPTDGRTGGVPDFTTAGPDWIQIGTESGFLPKPAVIPAQPITWNADQTMFNFGNVQDHSLLLGTAERADVIVDFSKYAGKTLILYNDAPTAFPALDPRTDYYTGMPDMTDTGGTTTPTVGFGPNTRTIMQIKVEAAPIAAPFDMTALEAAFASTNTRQGVFAASQNPIIVPDARYGSAYNVTSFTPDPYVRIYQNEMTVRTLDERTVTIPLEPKAIQDEMGETFDMKYGRMSAKLGLELPGTNSVNQNFILYGFLDPPTENLQDSMTPLSRVGEDGTQIWKITHNGVDTHTVHFHLYDVQLVNRVGWDGFIRPPDDNELGWKDTIRVSPLEDTIVALKPVAPRLEFGVPDSIRPLNPTAPIGSTMDFANLDPLTGQPITPPITNQLFNFGWEYVFHCHLLSHEEMDMMRPVTLAVARSLPATPSLAATGLPGVPIDLTWIDPTPVADPTTLGNPANEIGFRIERADVSTLGVESTYTVVGTALANMTTFRDPTTAAGQAYRYRVVVFNAAGEVPSDAVTVAPPGFFATHTITPFASVGGTITPDIVQTVANGADSTTFTMAPAPAYHLADVWIDGVSVGAVSSYTFTNVVTDHTIWAFFALNTFTITPSAGPGGAISPSTPQAVNPGASSPLFTMTPATGYHVADVLIDGVSVGVVGTYRFTNVQADHTIAVTFALDTFTITPSAGAGGSITPSTVQTVAYGGSSVAFAIVPNANHHVLDVVVDGTSVGPVTTYQFTNVQANHTIAATFAIDTYTITPSAGANGSISPASVQTVPAGGSATFAVVPVTGYHVLDVLVDGTSVGAVTTYTFPNVMANHTISATFSIDLFTITPAAGAGGALTPDTPQTVAYGAGLTFAVTPLTGYYVLDVLVDGASVGPVTTYTFTNVQASHTISAAFASKWMLRLGGADRYATSLVAAAIAHPGWAGVTHLVVVGGQDRYLTDTVGAGGLAGIWDAPVLVLPYSSLRADLSAAIRAMPPGLQVHIIGGTGALSTKVESQLRALPNVASVDRIAGASRYETAALVARRMQLELGAAFPSTVLIVNGNLSVPIYDSMVASSIAMKQHFAVLLVTDTSVPAVTGAALFDLGLTDRYVIGTLTAVPETVRKALGVPAANRISGVNRYDVAAAAATKAVAMGWLQGNVIGVSSGGYDAVAASPFAGAKGGVMLYTTPTTVPVETATYLTTYKSGINGGWVFGGTSTLSETVRLRLLNYIQ